MDIYQQFIAKLKISLPSYNDSASIMAVYLSGSVARGDYIVGTSDIDIYVVCKDENKSLNISFEKYAKQIASEFLAEIMVWYPDVVSLAFTTYKDVKNGTSFLGKGPDYYGFINSAQLIYGKDLKKEIRKTDATENEKIAAEVLKQAKEIINQDISNELLTKFFIRGVFSLVFTAVHSFLVLKGVYLRGKKQLVEELFNFDTVNGEKMQRIYIFWLAFAEDTLTENDKLELLNLVKEVVSSF